MERLIVIGLMCLTLAGCSSLQLHSNSRPGWQADEVVANVALWTALVLTTKGLLEDAKEEF